MLLLKHVNTQVILCMHVCWYMVLTQQLLAGNFGKLWRNIRERTVWRNDITQAATASRVAYCTLLFADLAAPVIDVLNPDIVVKVPKGKRNRRR